VTNAADPRIVSGYDGRVVGNGQCVAFVRQVTGLPATAEWRRGAKVASAASVPEAGTAIATFDADGRYGNHTDGRSHAAILIARHDEGLVVWDQWLGQPVHQRIIRYRRGQGSAVNDADQYHVVTTTDAT
jgi:hypothetical protein